MDGTVTRSARGEWEGSRAFTLVELLVVIAIIGLLAALLMPALEAARESAQKAVCITNLSQIGKAVLLYTNSWDGWCPTLLNESENPMGPRYYLVKQSGAAQGLGLLIRLRHLPFDCLTCPASTFPEYIGHGASAMSFTEDGFSDPDVEDVASTYLYREPAEPYEQESVPHWRRKTIECPTAGKALAAEFLHSGSGVLCHEQIITGAYTLFTDGAVVWVKGDSEFSPDANTWQGPSYNEGLDGLGGKY